MMRPLIIVTLTASTWVSGRDVPLRIISPPAVSHARPGQTVPVEVATAERYEKVMLLRVGGNESDNSPDGGQELRTPPYRFIVRMPDVSAATRYVILVAGCRRPGDCDQAVVAVEVEPAWSIQDQVAKDVKDGPGIAVDTDGAPVLHRPAVVMPADPRVRDLSGTVELEIRPDSVGIVAGVEAISGPPGLRRHAVKSVANWHFSPKAGTAPRRVSISFDAGAGSGREPESSAEQLAVLGFPQNSICFHRTLAAGPYTVKALNIMGLSEGGEQELRRWLKNRIAPGVRGAARDDLGIGNLTNNFDGDLTVWIRRTGEDVTFTVTPPGLFHETVAEARRRMANYQCATECEAAHSAPPADGFPPPEQISVTEEIQARKIVSRVEAEYPMGAKISKIQGDVLVDVLIGKDGRVIRAEPRSGDFQLIDAARDAVSKWVWTPTIVRGQAVEVYSQVTVEFYFDR